jgi:aryl-alcohol dehydrogenase-like predicted oxidoreductase
MGKQQTAELVLGTAQLGLAYGAANTRGQPDEGQAQLILRAAANAGVRWIDTAAAYGTSEARVGAYLPAGSQCRVVTKLSPLDELDEEAAIAAVIRAVDTSVRRSCHRLRTDRLDALLLHRAHHLTWRDGAIWRRLKMLRDSGEIFDLGVSVYTPEEALAALASPCVRHLQLPFNLLDWRWRHSGVVEAIAARSDVTVHVRSVYLQGLLAAGAQARWPTITGVDAAALTFTLFHLARELKRDSVADLCLAYARAQDWIDGVVVGMEHSSQLALNLALFKRPALTWDEAAYVERSLPRAPEQLLNPAQWPKAA